MEEYVTSETKVINFNSDDISKYANFVIVPLRGSIGKEFKKESSKVIQLLERINLDDLDNLEYNGTKITNQFYNIVPKLNSKIKDPTMVEEGVLIVMDTTQDEEVISDRA